MAPKTQRLLRHDLAWALFILGMAVAFGLLEHWPLVQRSIRGELPAYLQKLRERRWEVQFQGVKTVSLAQAYDLWRQGQGLFIDARDPEEFAELHIPGAIDLSPDKLQKLGPAAVADIARGRPIVVYCSQESCDASLRVAEKLQSLGFTEVTALMAGFRAWDEAGYPVDTSR